MKFFETQKRTQLVVFFVFLLFLFLLTYLITGSIFPGAETQYLWFYSGLFMVLFSMFFIEPYYSAPTNVIGNSISILLVLVSIRKEFTGAKHVWWEIGAGYSLLMLFISMLAVLLKDKVKSLESWQNYSSELLKKVSVRFGSGKILYSAVFLYFILTYYSIQDIKILSLLLFWWIILVAEPQKLFTSIKNESKKSENSVGEIFGVQSKKIFLAKLFEDRPSVKKFDMVVFKYSMQDGDELYFYGIVFDSYLLNQEKWIKILQLPVYPKKDGPGIYLEKNIVYKKLIKEPTEIKKIIDRFVGVIAENSDIGLIKFEYSKQSGDISEGDLLEVSTDNKKVFYQVVNGITEKEALEEKNETGFIRGEAVQIGIWIEGKSGFEKYGWVPAINSIVLKAETSNIVTPEIKYPEYQIGVIPSTLLPSVLNLHDAVTHHMAILGITGAGKSFIAREIIKQVMVETKVVCLDFTGEYLAKLKTLNPIPIIPKKDGGLAETEKLIAQKADIKDKVKIIEFRDAIQKKLSQYIKEFVDNKQSNLGLFELPDLSNTTFILEFTQLFLDAVFKYAKEHEGNRVCIVIEEAHTVIPETNSLGDLGDYGSNKALVNKIGQIALQGRKYGVGFIIIAQRTANVSKTVLTQCNTVICFQAFDETSFNFLGNYIGKKLIQVLPNLKPYHAIIAGKAVKSNVPMIVDLTRKVE